MAWIHGGGLIWPQRAGAAALAALRPGRRRAAAAGRTGPGDQSAVSCRG